MISARHRDLEQSFHDAIFLYGFVIFRHLHSMPSVKGLLTRDMLDKFQVVIFAGLYGYLPSVSHVREQNKKILAPSSLACWDDESASSPSHFSMISYFG